MSKILVIRGADFSKVAIGHIPVVPDTPVVPDEPETPAVLMLSDAECTKVGYGISATTGGEVSGFNQWKTSDYINVQGYKSAILTTTNNANTFGLAWYDADKAFISGIIFRKQQNAGIAVPDNAAYIRFATYNGDYLAQTSIELSTVEPTHLTCTGGDCTILGSGIKATDGTLAPDFPQWGASDYVDISAYKSAVLTTTNSASSFGIAWYTADKTFISGVIYQNQAGAALTIPENAIYVRYCNQHTEAVAGALVLTILFSKQL